MIQSKKRSIMHVETTSPTDVKVNGNSDVEKINTEALVMHIREENAFIKNLVNAIPPDIYFNSESVKKLKGKKRSHPDKKLEETGLTKNSADLSTKTKQKRMKFGPEQRPVTEIIEDIALAEKSVKKKKKKGNNPPPKINVGQLACIDDLKARLEAKRALVRNCNEPNSAKKLELKKIRRLMNKLRMKEKRKLKKTNGIPVIPKEKKKKIIKPSVKPIYNKEGKMVFSKFDFTEAGLEARKKGKYSGKDYKKLLKKVENDETKIKELEDKDGNKAQQMKEKKKWKAALERAEGIKVKDDPELLKKTVKRQGLRKKKSAKEWTSRIESVKHKQEMKQKKRKENIDARKKEKIKKKIKVAVKKGRMIPGFS